ncbi:hypothetical protein LMG28614_01014 [Paraburkholderia ultramafica]|uniref:DUF2946 domain-containing protein n=1 Tax=Paraburkholderia ultramafica TaxID=1544867 RepID=A0A6S7AZ70_9BURK|nr:hypothetical protein LMG28614_01014 [Paraburkholderia ultramafica]
MSRFLRKIDSWLGLFAILMATLAPTISHTLAARANDDAMSGEHCSITSMNGISLMRDDAASKHAQMAGGDACRYCSLLAYLPAVPSVEALFVVAVRARQHTVATRFESVRRVEPLTFARPRAPPFAS